MTAASGLGQKEGPRLIRRKWRSRIMQLCWLKMENKKKLFKPGPAHEGLESEAEPEKKSGALRSGVASKMVESVL